MTLTPETLTRHELVGLRVRVVAADNPDLVGIEGRVVGETMRTLRVERTERRSADAESRTQSDDSTEHRSVCSQTQSGDSAERRSADASRVKTVPKQGSTFEFALTDEPADSGKGSGTASKPPSETAGVRSGQSGGRSERRSEAHRTPSDDGEGVAYVTVDGAELLSRPARRTEQTGDSKWR